jgi:hypothetical protein
MKMTQEKIDNILGGEDELVPSSGFLASVMDRVSAEAAAPPHLPFPWKRALPGMVLAAGGLGWAAYELVREAMLTSSRISFAAPHLNLAWSGPLEQAGWVVLALGASWLSWAVSRRMAGRAGLM